MWSWLESFWKRLATPVPGATHGSIHPRTTPGVHRATGSDEGLSNFTPRAQQVLALARKEADRCNHNFVGTEHLLLGLIVLGQGTAVAVLRKMGLDLEVVRLEVEKQVGTGPDQKMVGNIPYTPRVKKVLALAAREAKELNHTYIGTEHILLGLLREGGGVAAHVLKNLDVDIEQTRQEILKEIDPNFSPATSAAGSGPSASASTPPQPQTTPAFTSRQAQRLPVDTSKRYDVYCANGNQDVVVYRNARFKGIRHLLHNQHTDPFLLFVELELSDGKIVFLARSSIIRFHEHIPPPGPADVSGGTP